MKVCPQCGGSYPNDFQVCPRDQSPLQIASEFGPGMEIRNKWTILGKIGSGGMATVYRAQHRAFGTIRALKIIDARLAEDPGFVKRFHAEAVLAQKLNHPNVIRIEDLDTTDDGRPFIVMECVAGRDLRSIIREQGKLPIARALTITAQVASALAAAHKLGITHRDVKPDNILVVTSRDGEDQVKVTDFGIAKARHGSSAGTYTFGTDTGIAMGTPAYMSPEQVMGRSEGIDGRSDLYSLCIVLYEMLTGKLPFNSDTPLGMALSRLHEEPTPPQQVPGVQIPQLLSDVLMKALERDRERRFQTATELIDALQNYATATLSDTVPASFAARSAVSPSATDVFAGKAAPSSPKESEPTARIEAKPEPKKEAKPEPKKEMKDEPEKGKKDAARRAVQVKERRTGGRYLVIGAVVLALVAAGVEIQRYRSNGKQAPAEQTTTKPITKEDNQKPSADPNAGPNTSSDHQVPEPNVQSLIAEGERQWEQGNYDAAIASYQKVLKIDPRNSAAERGLLRVQKAKAEEEKALLGR